MNNFVKKIPVLRSVVRLLNRLFDNSPTKFENSKDYWISRYNTGGNSGPGSYNELAEYKANILNGFVLENDIESVIEFGSGDGNQLKYSNYPNYIGFDVSDKVIELCKNQFLEDQNKSFKLVSEYTDESAELVISLDVIYHLIEDEIFEDYMHKLFSSSSRFVIIYSSNKDDQTGNILPHVMHRKFTDWVKNNINDWELMEHIPNKIRFSGNANTGSFADFYIFKPMN
jgi:hypothetical protein